MSQTLSTIVSLVLSMIGLGFIVWLVIRSLKRSKEPLKLGFKIIFTVPFVIFCIWAGVKAGVAGPFIIVFMAIIMSYLWAPHLAELLASPLTDILDGGNEEPEKKPQYSAALARRKTNRPLEAVAVIREQLAKFPNDFEGVLLLANILAEDLNDLPGAEITLNNFCNSPGAPDRQMVAAWTQLADWHLKKAADVDSARRALQKICERFPETEFALHAEQRLAHLGETEKILLQHHDPQAIAVPEGVKNIGLLDSTEFLKPKEIEPGKLAAVYVKHLEQHPHDADVREKLAVIYARDFKRLDLATLELEQLINETRHTPKQIAGWLNQLANFQIELGADVATVTATLKKIAEDFPDRPDAEIAQRRLARLRQEFAGKKETPKVKIGVYEHNIGLKYGPPRQ